MVSHGYTSCRSRGDNLRLGILEADPAGYHGTRMRAIANTVAPNASIVMTTCTNDDPAAVWRLAEAGCAVIAMPFALSPTLTGLWSPWLNAAHSAGVLLFAAAGNGLPTTAFPASHPKVFACASVSAVDGTTAPRGGPTTGRVDIGCTAGDALSSGACVMAAGMACLWLGYGVFTHSRPDDRYSGFWDWLVRGRQPLPGGGWAPDCSTL